MSTLSRVIALMKKASVTYATWNPADKDASITLSGGNLTAVTGTSISQVRATIGKNTGKWYWEVLLGTGSGSVGPKLGIAQTGAATNNWTGAELSSWGYYPNNGGFYNNGSLFASASAAVAGDTLGFAWDANAGTLGVYKNNVLIGTISGITGPVYPSCGTAGVTSATYTANFGATALTYAPPAGYNVGLYS